MKTTWTCTRHTTATLVIDPATNHRDWTVGLNEACLLGRMMSPEAGPYRSCDFQPKAGDPA